MRTVIAALITVWFYRRNNQITTAVVLPVETVFTGAFNHGGIGVGHVPVGDVQRLPSAVVSCHWLSCSE